MKHVYQVNVDDVMGITLFSSLIKAVEYTVSLLKNRDITLKIETRKFSTFTHVHATDKNGDLTTISIDRIHVY